MKKIFSIFYIVLLLGMPHIVYSESFYVRPSNGSYGIEDGSSYENAWDGFKNIKWGLGSEKGKVDAGDILYVCGTHDEMLSIGASGSSGNKLTISGGYPTDPGIIDVRRASRHGLEAISNIYCSYLGC